MIFSSYQVRVPGKLLVAGDYAVLDPGQKAIVIAVDRYVTAYIERSSMYTISLPDLGMERIEWEINEKHVRFSLEDSRLKFIESAIEVASEFLQDKAIDMVPFHLIIHSELNDEKSGRKYGLGSSAAVVVAVISAMLELHCIEVSPPSPEHVFKLAAISHLQAQKNGSGIDIAASTFGGWIEYSAYDSDWVVNEIRSGVTLTRLIEKTWPNLNIRLLPASSCLKLCVGWTGAPASTAPMIEKVEQFRHLHPEEYEQFLQESATAVRKLKNGLEGKECLGVLSSISKNRAALKLLGERAGIAIESFKLKELCDVAEKYGSGKSSGAGGGDCGIAFIKEARHVEKLYQEWSDVGIQPLRLDVAKCGPIVIEYNCEPSMEEYYSDE